jgi:trehalose 6-phosphate synthase/phosphatase
LLCTNLQGISKGIVAERILASVKERGKQADFLLCIGDDRSDEDMFENIADIIGRNLVAPRTALFACTVGQKPSKAKFYLDDTFEVVTMLSALADATGPELETDSADESVAYISSLDIGDEQSESSDKPVEGS